MIEPEPAVVAGRRRRDLRAVAAAACALAAVLLGAVVLSRAAQPARVTVIGAVDARTGAAPPVPAPLAELSPQSVAQGGVALVSLKSDHVTAANAQFNGRVYPMVASNGVWSAILGAGQRVGTQTVLAPGAYPVLIRYQLAGTRSVGTQSLTLTVTAVNFPTDSLNLSGDQLGLVTPEVEQSDAAQLAQAYGAFTPKQLWQGAFTLPVQGAITTVFGDHVAYNGGPPVDSHPGIDIAVPLGTPVHASAAGVVAWTGQLPDHGNGVVIDHGLGVFTGYFHLSEIRAQIGQTVQAGDVIGLAGSTGLSTGPHVHWEVAVGGVNVDGMQFISEALP
jgi:murein DD-endopeptidase MepM/ murein hydrolase activator NlpD